MLYCVGPCAVINVLLTDYGLTQAVTRGGNLLSPLYYSLVMMLYCVGAVINVLLPDWGLTRAVTRGGNLRPIWQPVHAVTIDRVPSESTHMSPWPSQCHCQEAEEKMLTFQVSWVGEVCKCDIFTVKQGQVQWFTGSLQNKQRTHFQFQFYLF